MPVFATGSVYSPSLSKANYAVGHLTGYGGLRNSITMIVGIAAAQPAVYSDFSSVDFGNFSNGQLGYVEQLQAVEAPSGTSYTFQATVASSGSVGDKAWIAFFPNANPSGSDPVLAVAGPFIVGP